jgi:hypothetical protein
MTDLISVLPTLLVKLSDAFRAEEDKDGRVHQVDMAKVPFRLLCDFKDFERVDPMKGKLWGASIVLDPNLEDTEFVLHYRRAESGTVISTPPPENREKRFLKRIRLSYQPAATPAS